jgi:sirohydrochlorin ferrochelatase
VSLLLLLAASVAQPAAEPQTEAEILVVGRRLAGLSVIVGRDARGRFTCSLTASSGSRRLDAELCRTAARCVREGAGSNAAVAVCIDRRKPALLAGLRRRLADRRGHAS